MPDTHAHRREALRALLRSAELDALLVTNLINIRYLTGFTGSNAALLVSTAGEDDTVFCTDRRYTTQSATQVPDLARVVDRASASALASRLGDQAARFRRSGFESQHMSVELYDTVSGLAEGVRLVRTPGTVEQLRAVKDDAEIVALRSACATADRALADLLERGGVRAGRTERDVARELDSTMLDHGSAGPAFASIVATGPDSAIPHHRPTERVLAEGDFVKFDFGATIDGYHSDMTRMVVLGEPAAWQRELYDLVLTAQAAGRAAAVPATPTADVDTAARTVIEKGGYGAEFGHGLGHGVGLEVHEAPSLAGTGVGTLSAGMTVTVEPGVYLAEWGGVRIEDTLVVRDGECEILTRSTKELVVV